MIRLSGTLLLAVLLLGCGAAQEAPAIPPAGTPPVVTQTKELLPYAFNLTDHMGNLKTMTRRYEVVIVGRVQRILPGLPPPPAAAQGDRHVPGQKAMPDYVPSKPKNTRFEVVVLEPVKNSRRYSLKKGQRLEIVQNGWIEGTVVHQYMRDPLMMPGQEFLFFLRPSEGGTSWSMSAFSRLALENGKVVDTRWGEFAATRELNGKTRDEAVAAIRRVR